MGITMLSSLAANAAEKYVSIDPWSFYFAPQAENTNAATWIEAPVQFDSAGYAYISKTSGTYSTDVHLAATGGEYGRVKAGSNDQGYEKSYGSPVLGFTAPASGEYKIDFYAVNYDNRGIDVIMNATHGLMKPDNSVKIFHTTAISGWAESPTTDSVTVSLEAGDEITTKFTSNEDAFMRGCDFKYTVTDLASGRVYDATKITQDLTIPERDYGTNVFDLGNYNASSEKDNSMWSIYLSPTLYDDTWNDMGKWVNYPLEDSRNPDNNGIRIVSGTTQLSIYDSRADGWFFWRPAGDGESNGTGTMIIGWTAPESGNYIFDFEGFNFGSGDAKGDNTRHRLAYKKAGEASPTLIESFTNPGASQNVGGKHTTTLSVEEGETVYLLNDANIDGYGDSMDMRYTVTNASDGSKSWSASDMYKNELIDSPYRIWFVKHGDNDVADYMAANLIYNDEESRIIASKNDNWNGNYLSINSDGSFNARPDADDSLGGGNIAVTFDVPSDGIYKVEFDAQNINSEGTEEDWYETSRAILYHMTGRDSSLGEELENTGRIKRSEKSEFSHILSAQGGDKIILSINADNNSWMIHLFGHYKITKLEKFNFSYRQDNTNVSSASELLPGSTLTATLDYVDSKAQALTLVTAVYNSEGTMTAVGLSDPATSEPGVPTTLTASLTIPEMTEGSIVKSFVVDGINSLIPLTEADILE